MIDGRVHRPGRERQEPEIDSAPMADLDLSILKAIYVDEDEHMHGIMRMTLRALKIRQLRCLTSASEALELVSTWDPDVIFTEFTTRDLTGEAFIRQVRQGRREANRYIPIVVVTASTQADQVKLARDCGANSVIAKPVSSCMLQDRLIAIYEKPRTFVMARSYVGPDRRRRIRGFSGQEKRKPPSERRIKS